MAAAKKVSSACAESEEDDGLSGDLALWQKAWLSRHRDDLVRRVPTMDVVDQLIPRRAIDPDMDVYQNIDACHERKRKRTSSLALGLHRFTDSKDLLGFPGGADLGRLWRSGG